MIPALQQPNPAFPTPTDVDLQRGGAFTVEERLVPGPAGAPDVPLLICLPTSASRPVPAVYHMHGGGMISGDNRSGIRDVVDWAQDLELAVVSVEYRMPPKPSTRGRSRTAMRA